MWTCSGAPRRSMRRSISAWVSGIARGQSDAACGNGETAEEAIEMLEQDTSGGAAGALPEKAV
ncbi:MAG: hypothetical protein ROO76_19645 [Terriglobia bacterium]|nr:hypothetical protein [Terriglobia bacterium]